MATLSDQDILAIFKPYISVHKLNFRVPDPQFDLDDLVGKTITGHRIIENPKLYFPKGLSLDPAPEDFDVLEFGDGSLMLTEVWDFKSSSHLFAYYYNGHNILFGSLFGIRP